MVVVDVTGHRREPPTAHGLLVLVNPEVTGQSAETEVAREGCLSLPDLTANVRRPLRATIAALDPDGQRLCVESEAFEARALLHELDHLDGILFLDRVASLKDDVFRRKVYR
jgi:peptide deformylase